MTGFDNNTRDQYGKSINDYKAAYAAAAAKGDAAGMAAANAGANAIRIANGAAAQYAAADIKSVENGGTSGIVSNPDRWNTGGAGNVTGYNSAASSYFPSSGGIPAGYAGADFRNGTVTAPNGGTLNLHNWATDTTDYSTLMANAQTAAEFNKYAQDRVNKANAQGIDISQGNANGYKSNQDLYSEWLAKNGPQAHDYRINGQVGSGYYGMDGNGNWGYYDDAALTRKSANGGWDAYRSSDGRAANFELDSAGRLMPSMKPDASRAGQTVTVAAGNNAFAVEYGPLGTVKSVRPVNVDVSTLYPAQYDPSRDQGVSARGLLMQDEGADYAGPGSNLGSVKPGSAASWEAIMAGTTPAGTTPTGTVPTGTVPTGTVPTGTVPTGTVPTGTVPTGTVPTGPSLAEELASLYRGDDSPYMKALEALRAANEAAVQRTANALEGQKEDVNTSYANLFRQLYVDRMNNQKDIDQRMAAQGVTGGAAESTLLGLGTQYEEALRQGEQGRIGAIGSLDRAIEEARLNGDISTAQYAADLARENVNGYASVLRDLMAQQNADRAYYYQLGRDAVGDARYDRQWNYQLSRDAVGDSRYDQQWAYQLGLDAYNRQRSADDTAYARTQDALARQLQLAQLAAQYGDYSGYRALGINADSAEQSLYDQLRGYGATDYGTAFARLMQLGYGPTAADTMAAYYVQNYGAGASNAQPAATPQVSYNNGGLDRSVVRKVQEAWNAANPDKMIEVDGYWGPESQRVTPYGDAAAAKAKLGVTETSGAGGNGLSEQDYKRESYNVLEYLGGGFVQEAARLLDRIWGKLTERQRDAMQVTLSKYGMKYDPD